MRLSKLKFVTNRTKRNGLGATVSAKQILHTINNQLTIVIGKAALLASETEDAGLKKRCQEIETAAHNISRLLDSLNPDK